MLAVGFLPVTAFFSIPKEILITAIRVIPHFVKFLCSISFSSVFVIADIPTAIKSFVFAAVKGIACSSYHSACRSFSTFGVCVLAVKVFFIASAHFSSYTKKISFKSRRI